MQRLKTVTLVILSMLCVVSCSTLKPIPEKPKVIDLDVRILNNGYLWHPNEEPISVLDIEALNYVVIHYLDFRKIIEALQDE